MRNERNSLRQAAITAGILAALGVCTLGGDQPRVWAAEPSNNTAQAEAKTAAAQGVQAAADETENDGMSFDLEGVTVEAKRPDWEAKLSPGTVTVIRPDDYKGEQKDLPDLLKMVPGVHVRELNGKGQYTTVSVRGSTAAQVGVFVDGVLFNLGGDAAADISTIPVHNVERIEVYRGYIPARFGGTFMGGVINVVTKRPTKANVQASFGKSSFGGYKGNLQIDAPLGGGALMVGINRDQSDGDFKYKNFSYDKDKVYQAELSTAQSYEKNAFGEFNNAMKHWNIKDQSGIVVQVSTLAEYNAALQTYQSEISAGLNDSKKNIMDGCHYVGLFTDFTNANSFYDDITGTSAETQAKVYQSLVDGRWLLTQPSYWKVDNLADYLVAYNNDHGTNFTTIQEVMGNDYASGLGFDAFLEAMGVNSEGISNINNADRFLQYAEDYKKRAQAVKDNWRYRKANDYKNTDAIIKWQDDHWLAKATWKQIKRHLPHPSDANWGYLPFTDTDYSYSDPLNIYYHRNQKLTAKELLLGRRDTVGNLEWGWSINYLKQNKDYYIDDWQWVEQNSGSLLNSYAANSLWSKYDSRRLGAKIDGSYKAGDRHLIEFLVDASKEKMDIDGWRMFDYSNSSEDVRSRWRNYYEQEIFNVQIQDTITLNKKSDFWLTPSVRYNRSTILGRSDRYDEKNDPQHIKWLGKTDEQTDDKVTWQLALKKQFNDHFTLRATGGTYYRLLNMYEIAGDGAGILPMPNVGGTASVFPMPEEGKQWDISAIWDGKWLGTDTAKFQLTYFGRDSKRLLQLSSWNSFFFVYNNAASGKVNGVELQADMSWQKWDVNLQATYTQPTDIIYDKSALPNSQSFAKDGVITGVMTYQPKWEGTARFTYRPDKQWSLFTQCRYVDQIQLSIYDDASRTVQSSLTTWDLGVKYKINKSFQLAVGCNDIFNRALDMYQKNTFFANSNAYNIQYPLQGRTYYATLQYTY